MPNLFRHSTFDIRNFGLRQAERLQMVDVTMLLPFGVALAVIAGGTSLTYLDRGWPLAVRAAIGACLGFVVLGLFTIPFASTGLSLTTVGLSTLAVLAPLLIFIRPVARARAQEDASAALDSIRRIRPTDPATVVRAAALVCTAALLIAAFRGAAFETTDGIQPHSLANRIDLSLHLGIISELIWGTILPLVHPEFASVPLTYPFVVDVGAAVLARAGTSIVHALLLQNVILIVALIVILHYWAFDLTGSRLAAALTPIIVLFGSGLGWLVMLRDAAAAHETPLQFLMHLPHSYTLNTANLQWGNLATIMLIPQRSLDLGLPLVVVVMTLWWKALRCDASVAVDPNSAARRMLLAGVIAGLLPLTHTHSFGVVLLAGAALALLFPRWRLWPLFFAAAAVVSAPQLLWITSGSPVSAQRFFEWAPGWARGTESVAWFWFKNTGLFIPLLIVALVAPVRWISPELRRFFLPFLLFFIVPNLFRVAPRIWDSNKVLIYWYIAAAPLVALMLARLARRNPAARLAVLGLFLSLTAAGLLDAWRVAFGTVTVTIFDAAARDFAQVVRASTPPDAVLLRAPTASHPVLLSGRASLLGYPSRVKLHGLDPSRREADVTCLYVGCPDAPRLLESYGLDFLVVGPTERQAYAVNDRFVGQFPIVGEAGGYQLRRIHDQSLAQR
jgi:hypothetical protein